VLPLSLGWPRQILVFFLAYIATDFINGLVHMYMDNNDDYSSPAGPLIASFHLHHQTPPYRPRNILLVYFNETGSKIWLVAILGAGAVLVRAGTISPVLAYMIMYFGVLSSVAELAHYRCHIRESKLTRFFGGTGLFISKRHHSRHHQEDNVNYAFLNGRSDPVLNLIARIVYPGYKNTTDRHFALYTGPGTENRAAGKHQRIGD
jgi:sterol desaturase/sphingolipid hydroxylase (fatty acid hydroxylase superfamily)